MGDHLRHRLTFVERKYTLFTASGDLQQIETDPVSFVKFTVPVDHVLPSVLSTKTILRIFLNADTSLDMSNRAGKRKCMFTVMLAKYIMVERTAITLVSYSFLKVFLTSMY